MSNEIKAGQIYAHFKGNYYRVIACNVKGATDPNTLFVVYESLKDGTQWMREQTEFMGYHENGCKRFTYTGCYRQGLYRLLSSRRKK